MKILLVHQYFLEKEDSGGSRFNEMTQTWASQGHKITVLAGTVHYATGKKLKKYKGKFIHKDVQFYENVDVVRCYVSTSYHLGFVGRLWAYFSFVLSSIYAGIFSTKEKYDIIIATSPPLFVGVTVYILSMIKKVPFVFEVRDLWPESAIDVGLLKNRMMIKFAYWFEEFIYKKAKLINVLTPAFRDKLMEKKYIHSEKIIFIPNAADFTLAKKIKENFDAGAFKRQLGLKDKFVITYVGAHGVGNHLIQLVEAAETLRQTNIVFQLVGDGAQKEFLQKEVKKRNLKNVIFRDSVAKQEVFKYILASDVGVSILKKIDNFKTIYSNKTFDYMSCKKPILLAIDGVSRQLIEEAKCGIYVEPENIASIVSGIWELYNKSDVERQKMGENGYIFAKINFDRKKLATEYISKIKTIVT